MFTAARTLAAAGVGLSALVFAGTAAGAPPAAPNQGIQTLLNNLSGGYSPADCQPTTPNGTAVADINCGANHDPGGPGGGLHPIRQRHRHEQYFNGALRAGKTLPFPDGTPGPGTWQQHATPNQSPCRTRTVSLPMANDSPLDQQCTEILESPVPTATTTSPCTTGGSRRADPSAVRPQ